MNDTAEIAALRTMLKNVNREYSATVRAQEGEERGVKLEGLKRQRLALMSSIAELRGNRGAETVTACAPVSEARVNEPLTSAIALRIDR